MFSPILSTADPLNRRLKQGDDDEEDKFDAMGNKIEGNKKAKKLTSAELRKKKKDRMARRKKGEEGTFLFLPF